MKLAMSVAVFGALLVLPGCSAEDPGPQTQSPPKKTATTPPPNKEPEKPAPTGVYPLRAGVFADADFADLASFGAAIGERTTVGLGESYHTTGGQYDMKARLMRYLIEVKGFRAITMETPWLSAQAATDYVAGRGTFTAADAMHSVFGVFWDTSLEAFFAWLRTYNAEHTKDPVVFYGFDIQEPELLIPKVKEGAHAISSESAGEVDAALAPCIGSTAFAEEDHDIYYGKTKFSESRYLGCKSGMDTLDNWVTAHGSEVQALPKDMADAFRIARMNARTMNEESYLINVDFEANPRDAGMEACFRAQRSAYFPGKKAVLWAHNGHLQKTYDDVTRYGNVMGYLLSKSIGKDYFAVGLSSYEIDLNWPGLAEGPTKPNNGSDSFELALHKKGLPFLWVDHTIDGEFGPGKKFGYDKQGTIEKKAVVADQFDATVFVDKSRASEYTRP